jgi:hypothetical protein
MKHNVRFSVKRVLALNAKGLNLSQIALRMGFPENCGQNRCAEALIREGVYKRTPRKKAIRKVARKTTTKK